MLLTTFVDRGVQLAWQARDVLLEPGVIEYTPEFSVIMHMAWIEVVSDRALEERCVLRDDCQSSA